MREDEVEESLLFGAETGVDIDSRIGGSNLAAERWDGLDHGQLAIAVDQHVIGGKRFAAATVAFDAAGGMGYSRRIVLPSTTPQPAALRAGSMCSALVSASFMIRF
jgi:hypothetical protein